MLRVALAAFSLFALLEDKGAEQDKALVMRSYQVGDLSVWSQNDGFDPSVLMNLLETIEPESWVSSGKGKGEMTPVVESESLLVAQSEEVQASIAALLDKMRENASRERDAESWKSTRHRTTRIYAVSDLVTPWLIKGKGKPDFDSLVELIKTQTAAGQWDAESEIKVDESRYLLTVIHAPVVHTEIEELLAKLRKVHEQYANRIDNGKCGHCGLGAAPEHGEYCEKCKFQRCDPYTVPSLD